MRTLIIHDREVVGLELARIAQERAGVSSTVETAKDVFGARDRLRAGFYDLVALDLTLPIRYGKGDATLANAEYLLEEIFEGGEVRSPGDVIGISLESSVLELVRTTIGQHLMACIHEDSAGTWREAFAAKVDYLVKARRARQLVANSSHDADLVLLTALDKEARPYAELFELRPSDNFPRAFEFTFSSADGTMRRGLLYSVGQSGQAPCGSAAQALLTQFRPKLMLMTGFCGGVRDRTTFGDVIAFRSSSAWDYGKWEEEGEGDRKTTVFRARPTTLNVPEAGMFGIVRDIIANGYQPRDSTVASVTRSSGGELTSWELKSAPAGSGSAVVTSLEKIDQITALDENIRAIDMESYAFYYACRNTPVLPPDFMCLKAVADLCNGEKDNRFHEACSTISAHLAHEIVTKLYRF